MQALLGCTIISEKKVIFLTCTVLYTVFSAVQVSLHSVFHMNVPKQQRVNLGNELGITQWLDRTIPFRGKICKDYSCHEWTRVYLPWAGANWLFEIEWQDQPLRTLARSGCSWPGYKEFFSPSMRATVDFSEPRSKISMRRSLACKVYLKVRDTPHWLR